MVIGTDCIGSCKSNYHVIMATTAIYIAFCIIPKVHHKNSNVQSIATVFEYLSVKSPQGLVLYCYFNMPTINKTYLILSFFPSGTRIQNERKEIMKLMYWGKFM